MKLWRLISEIIDAIAYMLCLYTVRAFYIRKVQTKYNPFPAECTMKCIPPPYQAPHLQKS